MSVLLRTFLIFSLGLALSANAWAQQQALLLFGGKDHKQFLGCLNCGRYDSNSIWNAYGTYGSAYSAESIWNPYGTLGSPYSAESPWNKYASDAPVIVDKDGAFYGYFSANASIYNRTKINWLVWILDNYDYVIANLDKVRDKVS